MNKKSSFIYRIYYEDTDASGVVYHANYLKFFERARTDFLRERNILQSQLAEEQDTIFVIKKCQIEYKAPAKLDDLVIINTIITNIGVASIEMHQEMIRKKDNKLLNILEIKITCVSKQSIRPKKITQEIITKFRHC